jgi:hypothetical protein
VPYWVGLRTVARHLAETPTQPWLRYWLRHGDRTFIGLGFICEAFAPPTDPGGDWATGPDRQSADLRMLTARDIDGRIYQIQRHRGGDTRVAVTPDPPDALRTRVIPDCLSQMTSTFQHLGGG